jgi:hypothetical protein
VNSVYACFYVALVLCTNFIVPKHKGVSSSKINEISLSYSLGIINTIIIINNGLSHNLCCPKIEKKPSLFAKRFTLHVGCRLFQVGDNYVITPLATEIV